MKPGVVRVKVAVVEEILARAYLAHTSEVGGAGKVKLKVREEEEAENLSPSHICPVLKGDESSFSWSRATV